MANYLLDTYSGAVVSWSFIKERAAHGAACCDLRRADNATLTLGWAAEANGMIRADKAAFTTFAAGQQVFMSKGYGQDTVGLDIVQTTGTKQCEVVVDPDDGELALKTAAGCGYEVATSSNYVVPKLTVFVMMKAGVRKSDGIANGGDGCIISHTPTGNYFEQASWGWGLVFRSSFYVPRPGCALNGSQITSPPNGNPFSVIDQFVYGQLYTTDYQVWQFKTETLEVKCDSKVLAAAGASVDVTYAGGTQKLMILTDFDYTNSFTGGYVKGIHLYPTTRADDAAIVTFLKTRMPTSGVTLTWTDSDGFAWIDQDAPGYYPRGQFTLAGHTWQSHSGCYLRSISHPTNVNNGKSLISIRNRIYDSDVVITDSERCEILDQDYIMQRGVVNDIYFQFMKKSLAPITDATHNWFDNLQAHWDNNNLPGTFRDTIALEMGGSGDQMWLATDKLGATTRQGAPFQVVPGVKYGIRIQFLFNADGTGWAKMWIDFITSTSMSQVLNLTTGAYFDDATPYPVGGCNLKLGNYRGFPGVPQDFEIQYANIFNGNADLTGMLTSQPVWPTNPAVDVFTLSQYTLDSGLAALRAAATHVELCSGPPATYADIASLSLGSRAVSVAGPSVASGGRKVTVPGTTVIASVGGSANHWALTDHVNSLLLAKGPLARTIPVSAGQSWAVPPIDIKMSR